MRTHRISLHQINSNERAASRLQKLLHVPDNRIQCLSNTHFHMKFDPILQLAAVSVVWGSLPFGSTTAAIFCHVTYLRLRGLVCIRGCEQSKCVQCVYLPLQRPADLERLQIVLGRPSSRLQKVKFTPGYV